MGYVSPYKDKHKSNEAKQKLETGTISKVPSRDFTKEELEFLWDQHNSALKEFDQPKERYTRFLSELIIRFRDIASKLIEANAIPNHEIQDTAIYVRKQLKQKGVPLNNHFYEYFQPEQKREWQSDEIKKINSTHVHDWVKVGSSQLGEMKKCVPSGDILCGAIMIDGKIYEYTPEDVQDPDEPKQKKKIPIFNEQCMPIIEAYQNAGNNLYDFAGILKKNSHLLTDNEISELRQEVFLINKAGEFLMKTARNKKQIIDPFTMHLLVLAYGEATQNVAGGKFIMNRIDLAERKHSEGYKTFKKMDEFAVLLSEKQTKKAMEGKIKEIHERYEPTNEKKAMDCGFSGQQCPNCKGMRVGYDRILNGKWKEGDPIHTKFDTVLTCFNCNHIPERRTYSLPKQTPLVKVNWDSNQ